MNPELQNIIRAQFKSLPDALQQYAISPEVSTRIGLVVSESGFHDTQKKKLEMKIMLVVLGIILPTELVSDLSRTFAISEGAATQLARKIDSLVLSPVRDILKAIESLTQTNEISSPETKKSSLEMQKDLNIKKEPIAPLKSAFPEKATFTPPPAPPVQSGPIPNLRTMPRDLARLKMQESVRLPKDEISMRYKTEEAQHIAPKKAEEPPKHGGGDPYRENPNEQSTTNNKQ